MLGTLIQAILESFWNCVPRPKLIDSTDHCVAVILGRWSRVLHPQLIIEWPVFESVDFYPSVPDLVTTDMIGAVDADGKRWHLQLAVEFQIIDPLAHHFGSQEHEGRLSQHARSLAVEFLPLGLDLCQMICQVLQDSWRDRGLQVLSVRVVSKIPGNSILLSGWQ